MARTISTAWVKLMTEDDLHLFVVTEKPIFVFDKPDKKASESERKLLSTSVLSSVPQAGRNEIKKEGKVTVSWRTDLGAAKRPTFKGGRVSRTLISVDRLQKNRSGCDSQEEPVTQCQHIRTGGTMSLTREKMHVHSGHVELGVDECFESRKLFECCTAELPSGDFVSPSSGLADEQLARRGCGEMTSRDESILTLNVVGEALEEDTGCELEDETGQDGGSEDHVGPKTAHQEIGRGARSHKSTVQKLVRGVCERTRNCCEAPEER